MWLVDTFSMYQKVQGVKSTKIFFYYRFPLRALSLITLESPILYLLALGTKISGSIVG